MLATIRTELLAQDIHLKPTYIQQLPSIEALLLHLEGKGRKPSTRYLDPNRECWQLVQKLIKQNDETD